MKRLKCNCWLYSCTNEPFNTRRINEKDINGETTYSEVIPERVEYCKLRKEYAKQLGIIALKLTEYRKQFGMETDGTTTENIL